MTVPDAEADGLRRDLSTLADEGLEVRVDLGDEAHLEAATQLLDLQVVGNDRPGIVTEISRAVAGCGMTIAQIDTALREAPHAAVPLFELKAVIAAEPDADVEALRTALEAIAIDLVVDVELA